MTPGTGQPFTSSSMTGKNELINQLQEISGASLQQATEAFMLTGGDVKKALNMLSKGVKQEINSPYVIDSTPDKSRPTKEVIEINDDKDDDLAKAIQLSLQDAHGVFGHSVSEEDREISKVLEASLIESRGGSKRKRGNVWQSFIDPENPHDRKRKEDFPVGLKNVGNTCWFSAVIQSLFHITKFRELILDSKLPTDTSLIKEKPKLMFLYELQKLFAFLLHSDRKYVDPIRSIEILEDAEKGNRNESPGDQQDVSEFTHVLLDWLEDAFKLNKEEKLDTENPIADLFYGRYSVNGSQNGDENRSEEKFGAIPVHVRGHKDIYDGLDHAMVNTEIRTNCNTIANSPSHREHWFTHLPVVLTFELSRFIFNQQLVKAEKIHDQFHIEKVIYLARYMEANKEITREKRKKVTRLRRRQKELLSKLDRYMEFGSKAKKKVPIASTLDSTMEFIQMGLKNKDDDDEQMSTSPQSSPNSKNEDITDHSLFMASAESVHGPFPKNISQQDGNTMLEFLKEWREEVENEAQTLKRAVELVENEVKDSYSEESLMKVPYRLHAILIHEGQANGGHYWSYAFDSKKDKWFKFNDISVTEASWDEISCEASGGYRNACAYCLFYVDATRSDVFELKDGHVDGSENHLQQLVIEDNQVFRKEIQDWDAKYLKNKTEAQSSVQPKPAKKPTHEEQLKIILDEQTKEFSKSSWKKNFPRVDERLKSSTLFFLDAAAPSFVVDRAFLENFIETVDETEERNLPLKKHAKLILKKLAENTVEEASYKIWKNYFDIFLKSNACFVIGAEAHFKKRYQEAVPYLANAIMLNEELLASDLKPGHVDRSLLSHFRRKSLQMLNKEACELFKSPSMQAMQDGCNYVKELILPSVTILNKSGDEDDLIAVADIRQEWFSLVAHQPIVENKAELLEEILTNLVEGNSRGEMQCPEVKTAINRLELYDQYTKVVKMSNYKT